VGCHDLHGGAMHCLRDHSFSSCRREHGAVGERRTQGHGVVALLLYRWEVRRAKGRGIQIYNIVLKQGLASGLQKFDAGALLIP
jgi:hypothetical protein